MPDGRPPAPDPHAEFVETVLRDGTPDWNGITFDVLCYRCGYNLRMLPQPRCPECGLEFTWGDALAAAAARNDFLFEDHWRTRPIRSWLTTVGRSFRPWRFWRDASPRRQSHTGPLWFMLAFSVISSLVVLHATAGLAQLILDVVDLIWPLPPSRFGPPIRFADLKGLLHAVLIWPATDPLVYVAYILIMSLVVFTTLLALSWWPTVVRQCQSRWMPLIRLVAYTASPILILWSLWLLLCVTMFVLANIRDDVISMAMLFTPPPLLLIIYLAIGLKRYLRVPHPWIPAVLSVAAAIVITIVMVVACQIIAHNLLQE